MNKIFIPLIVLVVLAGAAFVVFRQSSTPIPVTGVPPTTSSTTPPTPTPTPVAKGIVTGKVLLGPTCPVERIPPDPNCAPRPYQTTIRIQPINPSAPYMNISTDASGVFSISLDPGTYMFKPQGGASMPPTCRETQVVVSGGHAQTVNLDCDTGIR